MPGFNIGNGGLFSSDLGALSNRVDPRRKHRYSLTIDGLDTDVTLFLKKASRPKISIDVIETRHIQEYAYWDGQSKWDPITIEFYDIDGEPDSSKLIYEWLTSTVIDIENTNGPQTFNPSEYKKECILNIYSNDGGSNERWRLLNCWPFSVDWNDLDYSSTELQTIAVELRFDRAKREVDAQSARALFG